MVEPFIPPDHSAGTSFDRGLCSSEQADPQPASIAVLTNTLTPLQDLLLIQGLVACRLEPHSLMSHGLMI
jgi:hypothetical protein